jgi:hypothetical protein
MSFLNKIEILSMAFTRDAWIAKARHRLEGALGEYAKQRYALLIGFDYDWTDEVTALMQKVKDLFNPQKTRLNQWKDLDKAFKEAYFEASSAHEQLVDSKNQFINKYLKPKEVKNFMAVYKSAKLTSEDLLHDMVKEFAPELLACIKK